MCIVVQWGSFTSGSWANTVSGSGHYFSAMTLSFWPPVARFTFFTWPLKSLFFYYYCLYRAKTVQCLNMHCLLLAGMWNESEPKGLHYAPINAFGYEDIINFRQLPEYHLMMPLNSLISKTGITEKELYLFDWLSIGAKRSSWVWFLGNTHTYKMFWVKASNKWRILTLTMNCCMIIS